MRLLNLQLVNLHFQIISGIPRLRGKSVVLKHCPSRKICRQWKGLQQNVVWTCTSARDPQKAIATRFIQEIAQGTLLASHFGGYMVQDLLTSQMQPKCMSKLLKRCNPKEMNNSPRFTWHRPRSKTLTTNRPSKVGKLKMLKAWKRVERSKCTWNISVLWRKHIQITYR